AMAIEELPERKRRQRRFDGVQWQSAVAHYGVEELADQLIANRAETGKAMEFYRADQLTHPAADLAGLENPAAGLTAFMDEAFQSPDDVDTLRLGVKLHRQHRLRRSAGPAFLVHVPAL